MNLRSPVASAVAVMVCLLSLSVLAPLPGCQAGQKARGEVLVPALVLTSDGFESDVYAGIAALPADDQADSTAVAEAYFGAVRSGDLTRIVSEALPVWPSLRALGISGVNAKLDQGLIGPLGAASKLERINNVEIALGKATGAFGR